MGSILVLFTIALLGVGASVLSLSAKGEEFLDPILLFLLVSYPVILFFAVYTQLRITKFKQSVSEHLLSRWHLYSFIKTCSTETDLNIIAEEALLTITRLVEPSFTRIYQFDKAGQQLEVLKQTGQTPAQTPEAYAFDEAIPAWVIKNKNAVVINDLAKEQYLGTGTGGTASEFRSLAAVPAVSGNQPVGLFMLLAKQTGFFNDTNILLIQMIANLYATAISRA